MIKQNYQVSVPQKEKDIKQKVAVAMGDGIGPEIMKATLKILDKAGAKIEPEYIELGEQVYLSNNSSGITDASWDTIADAGVILKAPITTPQGKGYKSLNVTLRKSLGLYANVRPVVSFHPFVATNHTEMDVVIIRENEEDLYAGIEHRQTQDVVQCLKLISRPGCERIINYAFEYARAYGRKKVTCMIKDNIMKLTDGLFHEVFDEVSKKYPEIKADSQIIDIGAARLANRPQDYDVIVTSNLYGDIISDIAAEIAGSVGMAGSANIGSNVAMFEAIHGSAPDIAGLGIANPSGLLNAATLMLAHIGQKEAADKIRNAWLYTIEQGQHTADIYKEGVSQRKLTTDDFTDAIISNLGCEPKTLLKSSFSAGNGAIQTIDYVREVQNKELVGVDVFLDWNGGNPNQLGEALDRLNGSKLELKMITNRGVKVYPNGQKETYCTDHWRCRFVSSDADINRKEPDYRPIDFEQVIALLHELYTAQFDVIKTENLYTFDGKRGFSLGQGE